MSPYSSQHLSAFSSKHWSYNQLQGSSEAWLETCACSDFLFQTLGLLEVCHVLVFAERTLNRQLANWLALLGCSGCHEVSIVALGSCCCNLYRLILLITILIKVLHQWID